MTQPLRTRRLSLNNKTVRTFWQTVWLLLYRPTPRIFHPLRRFLLRLFGAKLGKGVHPHPSARVWAPWNLEMGDHACLGEGVLPDLLCLGKGLGGGLPLSVCLGPPEVMDVWPLSDGEAIHTSTFLGHPLACAAGLALLDELEKGGLVERSRQMGLELLNGFREGLADVPEVAEIRGRGLFLGIELAEPGNGAPMPGKAVEVAVEALRRGILVLPAGQAGHVLEISPPLILERAQSGWALSNLVGILREVLGPGS